MVAEESPQESSEKRAEKITKKHETWDLWYSKAAATGISFARGRVAAGATTMLVHAAPEYLTVTIYDGNGQRVVEAKDLSKVAETPVTRLTRKGDHLEREDIWPGEGEIGQLIILPGGEVGTLQKWWHAEDHSEWRWQIELYNRRE